MAADNAHGTQITRRPAEKTFQDAKSLGVQRITYVSRRLEFPEENFMKMIYEAQVKFVVESETRLYRQAYHWTGSGVHGRPEIHVKVAGQDVPARLHGPMWEEDGVFSYLIDLSRTVEPGRSVEISSRQVFVDEGGSFEHRLGLENEHEHDLRLSLAFAGVIHGASYSFRPVEDKSETLIDLENKSVGSLFFTEVEHFVPAAQPGVHRLTWDFDTNSDTMGEGGGTMDGFE